MPSKADSVEDEKEELPSLPRARATAAAATGHLQIVDYIDGSAAAAAAMGRRDQEKWQTAGAFSWKWKQVQDDEGVSCLCVSEKSMKVGVYLFISARWRWAQCAFLWAFGHGREERHFEFQKGFLALYESSMKCRRKRIIYVIGDDSKHFFSINKGKKLEEQPWLLQYSYQKKLMLLGKKEAQKGDVGKGVAKGTAGVRGKATLTKEKSASVITRGAAVGNAVGKSASFTMKTSTTPVVVFGGEEQGTISGSDICQMMRNSPMYIPSWRVFMDFKDDDSFIRSQILKGATLSIVMGVRHEESIDQTWSWFIHGEGRYDSKEKYKKAIKDRDAQLTQYCEDLVVLYAKCEALDVENVHLYFALKQLKEECDVQRMEFGMRASKKGNDICVEKVRQCATNFDVSVLGEYGEIEGEYDDDDTTEGSQATDLGGAEEVPDSNSITDSLVVKIGLMAAKLSGGTGESSERRPTT
ncbi:hypothetical protein ACLOJK_010357 [Asimina triloba]